MDITLATLASRWTPLVLREFLRRGQARYSELPAALPTLSDKVLSDRLAQLTSAGMIERHRTWCMGTEIGSRNLADTDRYNLLPAIAKLFGLDTRNERTLWRDRALVELNLAVLHSYEQAGVSMADHHTESRRFLAHVDRERRHGRLVPTDWSWIVPPLSGGATAVFHRYYDPEDPDLRPAFVHRTAEVPQGCPYGAA
ncbi:nitric oxide synthase oxygenase [Streptomyces sp. NPDC002076]